MVDFGQDIKNCVQILEDGGSILYPTDTVWGLGCDATNEDAVNKIFVIKQRPREKSLIVLLAEPRDIFQYVAAPPPDIIAVLQNFKKPTTVIYEGALGFPANVVNTDGTIAIRVTTDPFCKALIKRFRKPIVSTSANLSGQAAPAIFKMIDIDIIDSCDYIVKYRQDDAIVHLPSQLVRILSDGGIQVLRA